MRLSIPLLLLVSLMLGCQVQGGQQSFSTLFREGAIAGVLDNPAIDEASGIDAGVANTNKYWTHNDSAGEPRIFLIDDKGSCTGSVLISSIKNRDWEDIAVGPGPQDGKSYVYIAEIGDNEAIYDFKYIYRIEEPVLKKNQELVITHVDSIKFQMPDGRRDTEAIFIDQKTKDLYVFSKREKQISLYTLPYPQSIDAISTATYLVTLPFTQIVAADYESTTGELLIKNYDSIYYWKKGTAETIVDMVKRRPEIIAYKPEPQGESICFDPDGSGFYTLSEKKKETPPLLFYKRN